jgi:LacI family transcriptional regulator, galactose operon repressor
MPHDKEITIYDIARQLNVSPATVSRSLNNHPSVRKETQKKIADLAKALGYRSNTFASNLRRQHTNTIGVIVPRFNIFQSMVIAGIENIANKEGYNLIVSQSEESAHKEIINVRTMFNNRVDGLLISLSYETENFSHFDVFFKKNIPLTFFDRVVEHKGCTNVIIDNRKAGYQATKHLIDQGCRRIVHITTTSKRNVYVDRFQGYKDALEAHGLDFKEEYIITNNLSAEEGAEAAVLISKMDPLPDGVFVAFDQCAVGCMIAIKKLGIRIPQDIAFVGFNNDSVSTVIEPNLTTINYPAYNMGEAAARNLINHLNGLSTIYSTDSIILRSELIIRESSLKMHAS